VEKMSKSKNNGVDPQSMIDKYGADTVRLFTMFAAPPDQSLEWNDDAIAGASRFMRRVWNLFDKHQLGLAESGLRPLGELVDANSQVKALRVITHSLVERAIRDFERQQFNTVVAAAMELTNAAEKADWKAMGEHRQLVLAELCYSLIKMLAPITPHLCEYLWDQFGASDTTLDDAWLTVEQSALVTDEIAYVVQVNGKLRGKIEVAASAGQEEIERLAQVDKNVQKFTDGLTVRKIIVVPEKLVNIVAN